MFNMGFLYHKEQINGAYVGPEPIVIIQNIIIYK
jgi:hypothetical protein